MGTNTQKATPAVATASIMFNLGLREQVLTAYFYAVCDLWARMQPENEHLYHGWYTWWLARRWLFSHWLVRKFWTNPVLEECWKMVKGLQFSWHVRDFWHWRHQQHDKLTWQVWHESDPYHMQGHFPAVFKLLESGEAGTWYFRKRSTGEFFYLVK